MIEILDDKLIMSFRIGSLIALRFTAHYDMKALALSLNALNKALADCAEAVAQGRLSEQDD